MFGLKTIGSMVRYFLWLCLELFIGLYIGSVVESSSELLVSTFFLLFDDLVPDFILLLLLGGAQVIQNQSPLGIEVNSGIRQYV